jgi:hypothetical protein
MGKAYLILDAANKVVGTYMWGSEVESGCPISPPAGGHCMEVDRQGRETILSLTMGGQTVVVTNDELWVDGNKIGTLLDGKVVLE